MEQQKREWRKLITEEYKRKYYPNGYFAYIEAENNSKVSMAGYWFAFIFIGIVANFALWIALLLLMIGEGVGVPFLVSTAIAIVWILLSSLFLRMGKKRKNRSREDWIAQVAKSSGLTEQDVQEFDRQVVESESWFLAPYGKLDSVIDYILTQDYIFAGTRVMMKIIPYRDILGGCFTYDENRTLSVALFTESNVSMINNNREFGTELLNMIKKRNPNMKLILGDALKPKDADKWAEELRNRMED